MISVCMATYNGERYIKEQLDSILCQLTEEDEVIISDDTSTDETIKIIQSFSDPRIILLPTKNFHNPIYNFENALNHASGDFIFLSDQDDIWMKNKVETMLAHLERFDVVISDCTVINEVGDMIHPSFYHINHSKEGFIHNIISNSYIGCCMAFNRTILNKALPFPSDTPMHDWWLGMIGETCGKTFFCDDPLIAYRRHQNNLSDSSGKSRYPFSTKIKFRLSLLKNLLKRCYLYV